MLHVSFFSFFVASCGFISSCIRKNVEQCDNRVSKKQLWTFASRLHAVAVTRLKTVRGKQRMWSKFHWKRLLFQGQKANDIKRNLGKHGGRDNDLDDCCLTIETARSWTCKNSRVIESCIRLLEILVRN